MLTFGLIVKVETYLRKSADNNKYLKNALNFLKPSHRTLSFLEELVKTTTASDKKGFDKFLRKKRQKGTLRKNISSFFWKANLKGLPFILLFMQRKTVNYNSLQRNEIGWMMKSNRAVARFEIWWDGHKVNMTEERVNLCEYKG